MHISTYIIVNNAEASDVLLTSLVSKSGIYTCRTASDFGSALDTIWPFFASLGCKRTSKEDLIRMDIVKKVHVCSNIMMAPSSLLNLNMT